MHLLRANSYKKHFFFDKAQLISLKRKVELLIKIRMKKNKIKSKKISFLSE